MRTSSILFLLSFLGGLVLGVISMLAGIDRNERGKRWVSYVNLPTVGAFLTLFGVGGYLFTRYSTLGIPAILAIAGGLGAAGAGGIVALIAGWAVPAAGREVIDPRFVLQGYLGSVSRAITAEGGGEVAFEVGRERRVSPARSLDGGSIPAGAEIVIERVEDGVAYVELWSRIAKQLELPSLDRDPDDGACACPSRRLRSDSEGWRHVGRGSVLDHIRRVLRASDRRRDGLLFLSHSARRPLPALRCAHPSRRVSWMERADALVPDQLVLPVPLGRAPAPWGALRSQRARGVSEKVRLRALSGRRAHPRTAPSMPASSRSTRRNHRSRRDRATPAAR